MVAVVNTCIVSGELSRRPLGLIAAAMAGLSGHLYPASETLNDPLIAKPRNLSAESPEESGIEVEETASRYRGSADTEQDALTNSTTRGGKDMDSSMSSSSQSGSTSSNSAIVLSGENKH